jgi:hypothetical protein
MKRCDGIDGDRKCPDAPSEIESEWWMLSPKKETRIGWKKKRKTASFVVGPKLFPLPSLNRLIHRQFGTQRILNELDDEMRSPLVNEGRPPSVQQR